MLQLDNHEIVGRKGVLLQLLPYKEDISANQYGVLTPSYSEYETDGGKWAAKMKDEEYSSLGKVLQISKASQEDLEKDKMDIAVGDIVSIPSNQNNPSNWFRVGKDIKTQDFEGYILVHPAMIQSKIINYEH